jgi:hypothetical protein
MTMDAPIDDHATFRARQSRHAGQFIARCPRAAV